MGRVQPTLNRTLYQTLWQLYVRIRQGETVKLLRSSVKSC
jgi:hypothetical protein